MMQDGPNDGTNVRSADYLVAHSVGACERCSRPTSLFSFGLLPGHETRLENEWVPVDAGVLLFHVEHLAAGSIGVMAELAPHYLLNHSDPTDSEYWMNHCRHCGAPQEDHWLHCEPDGAFLPTTAQAAEQIQFVHVRAPFAARVRGISVGLPSLAPIGLIG
jgi:hypothetical protein